MSRENIASLSSAESPHIVVVDGSRTTRRMIERVLQAELPGAVIHSCSDAAEALDRCEQEVIDLVSTALILPDLDGVALARKIREASPQRYIPIIVVSGDTRQRVADRDMGEHVTDYFDKGHGFEALSVFIRGYINPDTNVSGHVLYVEDSRVVAVATSRMISKHGLEVTHVVTVEDALAALDEDESIDLILTDVYLKGGLTGKDLLRTIRVERQKDRSELPVLVMTGDDNRDNQSELLKAGANDLVEKPIEERILINKLRFQLQLRKAASRA